VRAVCTNFPYGWAWGDVLANARSCPPKELAPVAISALDKVEFVGLECIVTLAIWGYVAEAEELIAFAKRKLGKADDWFQRLLEALAKDHGFGTLAELKKRGCRVRADYWETGTWVTGKTAGVKKLDKALFEEDLARDPIALFRHSFGHQLSFDYLVRQGRFPPKQLCRVMAQKLAGRELDVQTALLATMWGMVAGGRLLLDKHSAALFETGAAALEKRGLPVLFIVETLLEDGGYPIHKCMSEQHHFLMHREKYAGVDEYRRCVTGLAKKGRKHEGEKDAEEEVGAKKRKTDDSEA
jgi:hypothetical protein